MKKIKFICVAAMLCAFCLGCSEDDNTNGNNDNNSNVCKCSSSTCDNCKVENKSCDNKYLVSVTKISGLWNGKNVVHMSSETETCPNGCVTISETEAECKTVE